MTDQERSSTEEERERIVQPVVINSRQVRRTVLHRVSLPVPSLKRTK